MKPDSTGSAEAPDLVLATMPAKLQPDWRNRYLKFLAVFLGIYVGVASYQSYLKPLPAGVSLESAPITVLDSDVEFLYDVTGMQGAERVMRQMIFDRALKVVREAQDIVVVDMFLFNSYLGKDGRAYRKLCQELTDALLEQKRNRPLIRVIVITDPVNKAYGGPIPQHLKSLQEAGILVVFTDLSALRDSNPVYSSVWRIFVQWFGESQGGALPHPFSKDAGGVGVRSWLALLNFKANHRKVLVADAPRAGGSRELVSLVMSANPHDASSAHGNVALFVRGELGRSLLQCEQAVLALSGQQLHLDDLLPAYAKGPVAVQQAAGKDLTAKVLTEGAIRRGILNAINGAGKQDRLDLAMFYLSERDIIKALLAAAERGVAIRVLLDPNRDAFGYQKSGIPNRPVAAELMQRAGGKIQVRWCHTHGEQFHTKLLVVKNESRTTLITGSANATRRNIGDLNLETDILVTGFSNAAVFRAATDYFDGVWANQNLECTVPYENLAETNRAKYWQYRFQECSGISTF